MERLNEMEKRRPEFRPGTAVVLADGQAWSLRKPLMWFTPDDGNPSGFRMALELEPDDDYQSLVDAAHPERALNPDEDAAAVDRSEGIIRAQLALGRRLLLANYDLTPQEIGRILRFGYDAEQNPEGSRIRNEVLDVAEGLGPKPSPDGIESSLMPSGD